MLSSVKKHDIYKPPPVQDYSGNYCKLIIVILISLFIAGEFIGGYISGSISVISDAFHLVTDLIGFIVSFVFIYISRKQPNQTMTFGFHRMELIGALGNLFIIWTLAIFMFYQATQRIIDKQFVKQPLAMLIIGVGGLAINIIMYFVLHSGQHSHGLMSQSCDHNHQQQHSHHNEEQFTTSFCKQMICEDEICLKQVNQPHCHKKDQQGSPKIHYHQNKNYNQQQQITTDNLNENNKRKMNKQHVHGENCNHQHQNIQNNKIANSHHQHQEGHKCNGHHDHKHDHDHDHKHDHNHDHDHKHDHNHDHDHKHDHKHDHDHKHEHNHENQHNHHQHHQSLGMKAAVLHALCTYIQ